MKCIYCPNDAAQDTNVNHLVPYAAGNANKYRRILGELVLPPGLSCSRCNAYFGSHSDQDLANFPYVLQWRAVYGMVGRGSAAVYDDGRVRIETTPSGVVIIGGPGAELDRRGNLQVPRPSLGDVDHFRVSQAVHRVALEYELLEIAKARGVEAARRTASVAPLAKIVRYVRDGQRTQYRPYGVEGQGATRVNVAPFKWAADPTGRLVGPPPFSGCIICLPGARFSCTLADDPSLLRNMLTLIEQTEGAPYLTTRRVFWSRRSAGLVA